MQSIFDKKARDEIVGRLDRLTPHSTARWGRFDAPRVLSHITDALRQAAGDLDAAPIPSALSSPPVNWLVIHVLPWPKGKAQSPPEFLARSPGDWQGEIRECKRLVDACHAKGAGSTWPISPVFGRISGRSWGVLIYKHLDHHLRQFGA